MRKLGAMQDFPLRVTRLVDHAEREHGDGEIGSAWADGSITQTNWRSVARDGRRMALGGEAWTAKKTFGVRGGANVNTIGNRRTALSAGVSAMLRSRTYVDAEATGGTDAGRRGWSADLRLTF